MAEIEAEFGMLVSQFAQNSATDDECRDVEARYRDEPDTVVDDLARLHEDLGRLSANVDLNTETEREEVAQREAFLRARLDDLARARETLLESIREIELRTQRGSTRCSRRSEKPSKKCFRHSFRAARNDVADRYREPLGDGNRVAVQLREEAVALAASPAGSAR